MGIFDKLFGKGSATPEPFQMEPTAEMMGEDQYWKLIADSLDYAKDDQEAQLAYLRRELVGLDPEEIVGFRLRTDKLLYDTYTSEMWCAGWIMNGGCSDDSFEYFRLWVISRGREVYDNTRRDPDSLHSVADTPVPEGLFDLESLWYVANDAFEQKTGKICTTTSTTKTSNSARATTPNSTSTGPKKTRSRGGRFVLNYSNVFRTTFKLLIQNLSAL